MKYPYKVAVTSKSFSNHPLLCAELEQCFSVVSYNKTGATLEGDDLAEFLSDHDFAILSLDKVDDVLLQKLPMIKGIAKFGVGLDNIDVNALDKYKIPLAWEPGVNALAVAEFTLGLMLSLMRNIANSNFNLKSGLWKQSPGDQLSGKTIGIVGYGNVGKKLVSLLQGFDCHFNVYDVTLLASHSENPKIKHCELLYLLQNSDIISIHLPLIESTQNFFDERVLSLIKKGAYLINTSRGGIVDEEALKLLLMRKHLAGAASDVFAVEPCKDVDLLNLDGFLATPHLAGTTRESIYAMGQLAIAGLVKFAELNVAHADLNS